MTTPLKFYFHVSYNSSSSTEDNITITLRPLHPKYYDLHETIDYGIGINPGSPEPLSLIFANIDDAKDFYVNERILDLIQNINVAHDTNFVFDGFVYNIPDVLNGLAERQPLAETLTELSDLEVSEHIKNMMETVDKAAARDHLQLASMALEDASDYYTSAETDTALSGKAPTSHTHIANDISDATTVGKAVITAANAGAARTAIGAGTSSFSGAWTDITGKPSVFTPDTHTHVINDISNAGSVGKTILGASSAGTVRGAIFSAATHIADASTSAATDAATNGPTDAPTNAPTNYGALAAILGADVNATNTKQNATAANVNTLAGIVNANATKQNAGFTILNALATKFNLSLDILENNGLMAA